MPASVRSLPGGRAAGRVLRRGLVLGAAALLVACSTYSDTSTVVRRNLLGGGLDEAVSVLEKKGGKDPDVLNCLERGLLYHYEDRYRESNEVFQTADARIDEQYTKSLSGEALAFLTNDGNLPYSGYPHEQVLMHVYGALNYEYLGERDGALVEMRKVGLRLQQLEAVRDEKKGYTHDAFAEWLAGILFAEDGDGNAAMVSARRALDGYREYEELFGVPAPRAFLVDYVQWARRFGFADEAAPLLEAHPDLEEAAAPLGRDEGEVVLLYESGFVDHLEEAALSFPILKSDRDRSDAEMAVILTERGPRRTYVVPEKVTVDYWLRVALPVMVESQPALVRARLRVEERSAATEVAEDVSAIARLTFAEGEGKRLLKTILRALAKWKLTKTAGNEGSFAGFLANVTAVATERADTRSLTTLPDAVHVATLRLPAGVHTVTVECLDAQGRVGQTAVFEQVVVAPGERTLLRHRSYR